MNAPDAAEKAARLRVLLGLKTTKQKIGQDVMALCQRCNSLLELSRDLERQIRELEESVR